MIKKNTFANLFQNLTNIIKNTNKHDASERKSLHKKTCFC
ncbi:hypothetical protein FSS13T_19330 [Flavobacterium saliperosum S13]|uniref:Uncharacterized protein n=1 Tax=Flavobacterium saliperosum S13 TaxID=1341155 RepID=A0ABN0QFA3_9FLAO|nr:hypothetical protein FSS13T_19330 [Flavobacterium saliperosum S13]